jgi:predicted AAA+ superfamily ATPase
MEKNQLRQVIIDQQNYFKKEEDLIVRDINLERYFKGNEIVIISGIRQCGKSSL